MKLPVPLWCLLFCVVPFQTARAGDDWPQLLGPKMTGAADEAAIATSFPNQKPAVLWQANAGFGSAPPVTAGGRVFVFGLFKPGTKPQELGHPGSSPTLNEISQGAFASSDLPGTPTTIKKADYAAAFRGDLYAQCLDATSGKTVWATKLTDFGLAFKTNKHSGSGWEVASPLFADGMLYIHSHTGHLYCLNATDGQLKWDCNLFEHRMRTWFAGQQGNSSEPLKIGDRVVVGYDIDGCAGVGAFDAGTGVERWIAKAPKPAMNARSARISAAVLNGTPTVLCSCGSGTMGLEATTGKMRWWFDLAETNPDTMQKVPPKFAANEKTVKDYRVDAMRTPFPGYCPLVWQDYVIDAACVGHNSVNSATWCLRIDGDHATRVWQTSDFVPTVASLKSSMAIRDGKLYGFDSYFPGFMREYDVTRPYRGAQVGEFQCREVATGKLLWSTDAFNGETPGPQRPDSTNASIIVTESALIITDNHGLWIAQLRPDGVTVTAHVAEAGGKLGRMLGEPVLSGGRLFVRQLDDDAVAGLSPALKTSGNLFCLDVGQH